MLSLLSIFSLLSTIHHHLSLISDLLQCPLFLSHLMGSSGHATVQIEGKTFGFSARRVRDGGYVSISEKGRRKKRLMEVPMSMARWVWSVLGSPNSLAVGSAVNRRFGRLGAWLKSRSNFNGRFLEIGIDVMGKSSLVFVPGKRSEFPWAAFRAALGGVVDKEVDGAKSRGSGVGFSPSRSYRDAAVSGGGGADRRPSVAAAAVVTENEGHQSRVLQEALDAAREEARRVAREEATLVVREVATEVARVVATEVAHVVARETEKLIDVMRELIRGITEGFSNCFSMTNDLKAAGYAEDTIEEGSVAGDEGSGKLLSGNQKDTVTVHSSPNVNVEAGDGHQQGSESGEDDGSDFNYDSEDDFDICDQLDKENEDLNFDDLIPSIVEETQVDLEGVSLFDEETQVDGAVGAQKSVLLDDDKDESPTVGVDASHESPSVGLVRDPFDGATLGSKAADDRARIALAEIGCYLTHPTKKVPKTPLQVFTRRNKGLEGGLRKGFLG